jgi:hypothetical protein
MEPTAPPLSPTSMGVWITDGKIKKKIIIIEERRSPTVKENSIESLAIKNVSP